MKVNDILILVRQRLGDMQKIDFSDQELIYCLNNAIDRLSIEMSQNSDPNFVKVLKLSGSNRVEKPNDFIGLCGQFPLEWVQESPDKIYIKHLNPDYDGELDIRYFARRPNIKTLEDTIPFHELVLQKKLMQYTLYEVKPSLEHPEENKQ